MSSVSVSAAVLIMDEPSCKPIDLSSRNVLGSILGSDDFANKTFKASVFQRRPLLLRDTSHGKRLDKLREAMSDFDIPALLSSSASEDGVQVWLTNASRANDSTKDKPPLDSIRVDDKAAYKLYCSGHSLYCRAPPHIERLAVPNILRCLGYGIKPSGQTDRFSRGEVEMFCSRSGHVTGYHCDFQENVTVQITGSKQWRFHSGGPRNPMRGITPQFSAENNNEVPEQQLKLARLADPLFDAARVPSSSSSEGDEYVVTVGPGDVLYHPAGVWHRVECVDSGLSINISLSAASYADVFAAAVLQMLSQSVAYRCAVLQDRDASLRTIGSMMTALPQLLQAMAPQDFLPLPCFYDENDDEDNQNNDDDDDKEDEEEEEDDSESSETILEYSECVSAGLVLRRNPLGELLSEADLRAVGWRRSDVVEEAVRQCGFAAAVYVAHGCYCAESFESMHRSVLLIPADLAACTDGIMSKTDYGGFTAADVLAWDKKTVGDKRKRTCSSSGSRGKKRVEALLHLLHRAGVLSEAC